MIDTVCNIASHLPRRAEEQPYRLAVAFPHGRDRNGRVSYTHLTFRQLEEESNLLAAGLQAIGIGRGVRTVLMVKPSLEFFALTFALFKVGAVLVMVDPGMGIKNLGQCLAEAEPQAFIGIAKAHIARRLFGWGKATLHTLVTVGSSLWPSGKTLQQIRQLGEKANAFDPVPTSADDMAAILFTSGSTGVPKGVVYTHGMFASQVELLREAFHIEPGEIDLATFPLFALFAPALGMSAIIPDMDATRPALVDSSKIVQAINDFGVQNMFGSPALINRVGLYGEEHNIQLPTLKRVLSAGAPVPANVIERFTRMLPDETEVFTPYGATECLPVAVIGSKQILEETRYKTEQGAGVCVGTPVAGVEVNVIRISDEPITHWSDDLLLPAGDVGEIVVKGPQVTHRYYNREQSTKLAKIHGEDGSIYHRMGDLGYVDDQGLLWFCGRKSHRVSTPEGTLFTVACENIFHVHPAVCRTALVGVGESGQQKPVLCVELKPETRHLDHKSLIEELRKLGERHEQTQAIRTFLFHPSFPVDVRHNSKIYREKLAVWARKRV